VSKSGYWRERADKETFGNPSQGNQPPVVVKDEVERPGWAWGKQIRGMWFFSLQCSDTVGWATGRASGL